MKITEAKYIVSAVAEDNYPRLGLPEVAFAGRSNVGKSSLINQILGEKNLVKTSAQPGKTQTINFFLINKIFVFVDLPGYGYAKVPESMRKKWQPMMDEYLSSRKELALVVQLVDLRHDPTELDYLMHQWLDSYQIPSVIVATKSDKLKFQAKMTNLKKIKNSFPSLAGENIFSFSAKTGDGKQLLWKKIHEAFHLL